MIKENRLILLLFLLTYGFNNEIKSKYEDLFGKKDFEIK